MTATEITAPSRLSYSSLASYAECGERWRLERGFKIKSGTWWSSVAGTAIHELTELYDRGELKLPSQEKKLSPSEAAELDADFIRKAFERRLDRAEMKARERDGEIKPSGKVRKGFTKDGGPNKKDREWWLLFGPDYVRRYIEWRTLTRWEVAIMPDGRLAIELPVTVDIGGDPQLGFIDRVFITPQGDIVIVDLKNGNAPTSTLQLGVYRVALWKAYGIEAHFGTYWMGSDGEVTAMHDLKEYTEEYIDALFSMAWRGIRAGVFLPNVTSLCRGCGVRDWCRAQKGKLADKLPVEVPVLPSPKREDSQRDVSQITKP